MDPYPSITYNQLPVLGIENNVDDGAAFPEDVATELRAAKKRKAVHREQEQRRRDMLKERFNELGDLLGLKRAYQSDVVQAAIDEIKRLRLSIPAAQPPSSSLPTTSTATSTTTTRPAPSFSYSVHLPNEFKTRLTNPFESSSSSSSSLVFKIPRPLDTFVPLLAIDPASLEPIDLNQSMSDITGIELSKFKEWSLRMQPVKQLPEMKQLKSMMRQLVQSSRSDMQLTTQIQMPTTYGLGIDMSVSVHPVSDKGFLRYLLVIVHDHSFSPLSEEIARLVFGDSLPAPLSSVPSMMGAPPPPPPSPFPVPSPSSTYHHHPPHVTSAQLAQHGSHYNQHQQQQPIEQLHRPGGGGVVGAPRTYPLLVAASSSSSSATCSATSSSSSSFLTSVPLSWEHIDSVGRSIGAISPQIPPAGAVVDSSSSSGSSGSSAPSIFFTSPSSSLSPSTSSSTFQPSSPLLPSFPAAPASSPTGSGSLLSGKSIFSLDT